MAAGETGARAGLADAVRAEQVKLLYSGGPVSYLPTLGVAAILVVILLAQHTLDPVVAAVWMGAMVGQVAARIVLHRAYHRADPASWPPGPRRYTAACFIA